MTSLLKISFLVFAGFASVSNASAQDMNPDRFSALKQFTDAPFFFRENSMKSSDVNGVWPFTIEEGTVGCVKAEGVDFAFFEDKDDDNEPFMLSNNLFMMLIGKSITGSPYLRDDMDPKSIGSVLIAVYDVALQKCGPPYSQ